MKGFAKLARGCGGHRVAIHRNSLAFGMAFRKARILTPKSMQFNGLNAGVSLNGHERIESFNWPMLG